MVHDSTRETVPQYRAFISYSHADAAFAGWLHRKLEAAKDADGNRLTPIFIDRAELAAGPDLTAQVRAALAGSAALIVISSPAARVSHWVGQEIELFRELHPESPVYAALIEGEPNEAFPQPLLARNGQPVEPLAADFRKGHDGRRLGLLKIVAGLTGQPLDRLVQRDAQSRQRRVMAVTAGALLLSLVLSALLVVALRARSEAERQRAEAEGLVEFMLTDLRDRLKGVGRLDVMDAVNQRAMGYYESQASLARLSPDSLERRARVIGAMGEDDEQQGRSEAALIKYRELYRVTAAQLEADPNNPDRIFAHAASENRVGLSLTTMKRNAEAVPHLRASRDLLSRLPSKNAPARWTRLRSLVSGNLCAISLEERTMSALSLADCVDAVTQTQVHLVGTPGDNSARYDLAFHLLWLGDAQEALGRHHEAKQSHQKALETSAALNRLDPVNMLWREQHMEIAFRLAKIAKKSGDHATYETLIASAKQDNLLLVRQDPNNKYWSKYITKISTLEKDNDHDGTKH